MALFGFIGGAALLVAAVAAFGFMPAIPTAVLVSSSVIYGLLGAAMSGATVGLARRAPELPPGMQTQAARRAP